jgi:WD40 repeat protein
VDTWLARTVFSPDSKRLAAAIGSDVGIWDTATGNRLWQSPQLDTRVNALAFSPDGCRLATALGNTTILLWNVGSNK